MTAPAGLAWTEAELARSVPERFSAVARHFADKIAISDELGSRTYADLDAASSKLAQAIVACCGDRSEPVAILCEQTIDLVGTILGVLKAGKFYAFLDPQMPEDWLSRLIQDMQPALILCDQSRFSLAEKARQNTSQVMVIDDALARSPEAVLPIRKISSHDPAVIFYSSGSTGEPKGVLIEHISLVQRSWAAVRRNQVTANARLLSPQSFMFALSVSSLYGTILNGATLIKRNASRMSPLELIRQIEREKINSVTVAPSLLRAMIISMEENNLFMDVAYLGTGGERLYPEDVQRIRKRIPHSASICYLLGSTETTGAYASLVIDAGYELQGDTIPVGFPTPGFEFSLYDDNQTPVEAGKVGEIAVRGRFISRGYWNNPTLTAERYLPDPDGGDRRIFLTGDLGFFRPDGSLEFVGRKDQMVKVRGFRVEPGSVEASLRSLEWVDDAVVIAQTLASGDNRLVAYIVPAAWPHPTISTIRQELAARLSDHLIPTAYVFLSEMPRTITGKIDRQALPLPDKQRPELDTAYLPPRTAYEQKLCEIWAEVLEVDPVGIEDRFLDLGGHSLLAAQIISRILREFGVNISVQTFIQASTIAKLAVIIVGEQAGQLDAEEITRMLAEIDNSGDLA